VIRSLLGPKKYVIVVEHDLAVLDYLSDFVCCLYGKPGAYGVVTLPFSVREGINVFLAGFVPTENLRFREEALSFKVAVDTSESESAVAAASAAATAAASSSKSKKGKEKAGGGEGEEDEASATAVVGGKRYARFTYPAMTKTQGSFKLTVESGDFTDSEIIVMLGENGTGKTTLIRMLGGLLPPDDDGIEVPQFGVSYKPQKISPKFPGSVRELLHKRIRDAYLHPQFVSDVMRPLLIEPLMDQAVLNLSGGELQRVAITLALGAPADIYLIDEPSAYLDSEQRIIAAKVIKRFIMHAKKTAFIVEHDFIMVSWFFFFFF
jgi:ATP-binding cassette, sub-family E, member 1